MVCELRLVEEGRCISLQEALGSVIGQAVTSDEEIKKPASAGSTVLRGSKGRALRLWVVARLVATLRHRLLDFKPRIIAREVGLGHRNVSGMKVERLQRSSLYCLVPAIRE